MTIRYSGRSDIGRKRPFNEDRFLCQDLPAGPAGGSPRVLLAAADGIGGHAAGEVASGMAVDILGQAMLGPSAAAAAVPDPQVLAEAFLRANREIFQKSRRSPELAGMGTTLVAALVDGTRAAAANVGDSRLYRLRDGELAQVSRDHSWAAEQQRGRGLSETDIARSPFRNMVTRSIGYTESILVDTFELDVAPGDALLLCTDGLHGPLDDSEILRLLQRHEDPEEAAAALVRAANKAGGRDNITAVVARVSA